MEKKVVILNSVVWKCLITNYAKRKKSKINPTLIIQRTHNPRNHRKVYQIKKDTTRLNMEALGMEINMKDWSSDE